MTKRDKRNDKKEWIPRLDRGMTEQGDDRRNGFPVKLGDDKRWILIFMCPP